MKISIEAVAGILGVLFGGLIFFIKLYPIGGVKIFLYVLMAVAIGALLLSVFINKTFIPQHYSKSGLWTANLHFKVAFGQEIGFFVRASAFVAGALDCICLFTFGFLVGFAASFLLKV